MRVWDACTAPNYRTIAGGHNSRPLKGQRIRNRYFCKFYYYPRDFGPLGCVGCGRCVDFCPVNIDIVEMLHTVAEMRQKQGAPGVEVEP
jgi:sulfhydrogenase subunit beta (sulfur reductase)